ncbi:DEAD/DEAH box helicase [Embleya sp. NPDC056575]|uniref:DEAD/DEAH box helicase n=1 Tax=unclassified Embleya TaxID=2699296 RepID=UPI0036B06410
MATRASHPPLDLTRHAATFAPADPPRAGTVAFWPHEDGPDTITVLDADGVAHTHPAVRLPVTDAVRVLSRARRAPDAHPAAAFWGAATVLALQLVARGRMLPGLSAADHDAWRAGPLDAADVERVRALADAMPGEARAIPTDGGTLLPAATPLVRAFLDAVADTMPRTAAGPHAGDGAFAAPAARKLPALRPWSDRVAAGHDRGVRISLRLESNDVERAPFVAIVQAHSLADPTAVVDADTLWTGTDARFGERARPDVLVALRRAARIWPALEPLLTASVPDRVVVADDDLGTLLGAATARLAAAGVEVHWPRDLVRDLTAQAVIGAHDHAPRDLRAFLGGDTPLGFDWQLALGGDTLTTAELDALAESHRPVVRLRDRWVLVDPTVMARARNRSIKPLTPIEALTGALTGGIEVAGKRIEVGTSAWLDELRARIADPDGGGEPIGAPAALAATLRDYQLRGLRWLDRMTSLGLGGCLADDMGLGKTITLIALHLHRAADTEDPAGAAPTLVVCPASLLGNWEREITRFAPGTPVRRFHGGARSLDDLTTGFVLTTYGTMRLDAARLAAVPWGLVVADEAQHVKNHTSATAKALRRIPARARIALTGTPVENRLSELWAILDWTTPGLLGTASTFSRRWTKPVEADRDGPTAERLARLVAPFLLRRRKSDPGIAPELPAKTETDQPVALTREQVGLYEAAVREAMAELDAAGSDMARRGRIVKLLTGLKQICNHPAQYLKEPEPRLAGRSGKLELLDELLDTILAEDGSVLVFTQYVAMARLLRTHLTARGIGNQLLHGGTSVARRDALVTRFQEGAVPVFLLSLKAAGTGLNLTRADHVVHYDRWWNPAVEEQATDRAYRIGQTRPVQVHRFIAEGTIEDRIAEMLRDKRALADSVLAHGETALTELSDTELADLVRLRSAR